MEKVSPKNQMIKSTEVEVCFQCHKDRRAQFERPSHHPLREGDMTCSSCHNPHGSATDSLLRGASINETATSATPTSAGLSCGNTSPFARAA